MKQTQHVRNSRRIGLTSNTFKIQKVICEARIGYETYTDTYFHCRQILNRLKNVEHIVVNTLIVYHMHFAVFTSTSTIVCIFIRYIADIYIYIQGKEYTHTVYSVSKLKRPPCDVLASLFCSLFSFLLNSIFVLFV